MPLLSDAFLEITEAEIMATGDTVTTLRKMNDLRRLVDVVWQHATESTAVPSTKTANMLIERARLQCSSEGSSGALRAAAERVCWFDWSDNDMDAVAAMDALRKAVRNHGASGPFHGAECSSYPNCNGGCGLGCTKEMDGDGAKPGDGS